MNKFKKIILASKSEGRKSILEKAGLEFEVIPSDFVEDMTLPLSAKDLALHLSKGKAETLGEKYPHALIIAADTFVVFKDKFLGKPKDLDDAKRMLKELAGETHMVITGFTIKEGEKVATGVNSTYITMKEYDESRIQKYIETHEPLNKAGSYAVQGEGKILIEEIEGDIFNVIGLPIKTIAEILSEQFEVNIDMNNLESMCKSNSAIL